MQKPKWQASGRAAPPAVSGHPSHGSAVGGGNRGRALMAVQLPCRGAALAVSGCVRTQRVTVARAGRRALSDKSAQLLQQRATIRGIDRERWRTLPDAVIASWKRMQASKDAVVVASCFLLFTSCAALVVVFFVFFSQQQCRKGRWCSQVIQVFFSGSLKAQSVGC